MDNQKKLKLALITGLHNQFIAELITVFKNIPEIDFKEIIYWKQRMSLFKKLGKNIKKHSIIYIPYRLTRLFNEICLKKATRLFEKMLFCPKVEENIYSVCSHYGLTLYPIDNIHSPEGIELIRSLDCDILAICGTGILKRPVMSLPKIGTINLHQGYLPKYRGAPPGFWELWNGEKEVGVTIHFVDEGVDTGDIIIQKVVPIFEYDDLSSTEKKLREISLSLYPEAIRRIVTGAYTRIRQTKDMGKQFYFPTLKQSFQLCLKIKKRQINTREVIKALARKIFFPFVLLFIQFRDSHLLKRGKNIVSVLYYHRVTDICQDGMTVDIEEFEKQLRFLKKQYHILTAEEFQEWAHENRDGQKGRKGCLITFDDGYEDNYTNALPLLKKYSCPAIFFVSTGLIGNERQFEHDKEIQPQLMFKKMTWEQIHDARNFNIKVGIHTDNHANLGKSSFQKSIEEIDGSIKRFEEHFSEKPVLMSYPFGGKKDITNEVKTYIRNNTTITTLFSAYGGKNICPIDRYNVKRINIGSHDKGLIFWYKVEGGLQTIFSHHEKKTV